MSDHQARIQTDQAEDDELLSIGAFARRSRLSPKALRLYDRLGLLTPAHVDRSSGYRRYRVGQLVTARLIAQLRRLDMPLATVQSVISCPGPAGAARIAEYWAGVEARIASQRQLAAHLRIRLSGSEGGYEMYQVKERDVDEQVVLTEQRHVFVADLEEWIGSAGGRLLTAAGTLGGATGPMFVIYHGEVNEDSDGPVEVCIPVAKSTTVEEAPMRREPAHREAYVRITKAQVDFPQILSAYDAVAEWVGRQGLTASGSPREIYFTDFMAAAPADEVCDVAFPI